jgi:hypothetical protein
MNLRRRHHPHPKPNPNPTLFIAVSGADETNRTSDLLITNQLLYRLSYISNEPNFSRKSPNFKPYT